MEAIATAFIINWSGASHWRRGAHGKNRPSKTVFDMDFNKNTAGDPQNLEDLQNQCLERKEKEKAKENIHGTLIHFKNSFLWLF